MSPRGYARCGAAAVLLSTALVAAGCGQVSIGEESGSGDAATSVADGGTSGAPDATGDAAPPAPTTAPTTAPAPEPAPTPGPGAPEGCTELLPPLHRLVTGEGDRAATAEEVRRLADESTDNALSAVARRISGLSAQPGSDRAALDAEWGQVEQLCRVG